MWAPRVLDLEQLRGIPGLERLENRAWPGSDPHVHPQLTHLSRVMEPAIEQVADCVFSAVGFDVANSTFVVGDGGVVVIDAMASTENMQAALTAFREICDAPIAAVVYSHSHGDHWAGAPALIESGGSVPVIAQRQFLAEVAGINGFNQPIMQARSAYQFGDDLGVGPTGRVNVGAGPRLSLNECGGLVPPNIVVDDLLEIEIAGVRMTIVWAPGEAPDEIVVWLPDHRVLQAAECVQGECYPNLSTLRGDVPRPAAQWVASLDRLRTFPAEALAKSHGRSVVGADAAAEHLRNYRDVIAWTHDQTVRLMNQGYVPDQIVDRIGDMPPHLRAYETTGMEGYGSVPQAARSVYAWYLGSNTGEVTDFDPAPYDRRQRGYVEAMGGADAVCRLATEAIDDGDERWAIELLGHLVRSRPDHREARRLSALAHRRRGYEVANATWRNWYLMAAEELDGRVPAGKVTSARASLADLPLASLVRALPVRLRSEDVWYVESVVTLEVGGADPDAFGLLLRRGVLEVVEGRRDDADAWLTFDDRATFVDYLCGRPIADLEAAGRATVRGDAEIASRFASYLDHPPSPGRILVTLHGEATPVADSGAPPPSPPTLPVPSAVTRPG